MMMMEMETIVLGEKPNQIEFAQSYCKQRWANSVFGTEYKYENYLGSKIWPNTNIICVFIMTKYEYKCYSGSEI